MEFEHIKHPVNVLHKEHKLEEFKKYPESQDKQLVFTIQNMQPAKDVWQIMQVETFKKYKDLHYKQTEDDKHLEQPIWGVEHN